MSYNEAKLTSDFKKYLRTNPSASSLKFSFVAEYKLKHNKQTLHFLRDFQPQQIPSLLKAAYDCVYLKHSDMSLGLKPYDATQSCYVPAFVGVCWYAPRKSKILYLLDVRDVKAMIDRKCYKISQEEASKIAIFAIKL